MYSITIYPRRYTIINIVDSDSTSYCWIQQVTNILKKVKKTQHRPIFQLINNSAITKTQSGLLPINTDITPKHSTEHIFNGLHSLYIISLGKLCKDECIEILSKK